MSCMQLSEGGFQVVYPLGLWSRFWVHACMHAWPRSAWLTIVSILSLRHRSTNCITFATSGSVQGRPMHARAVQSCRLAVQVGLLRVDTVLRCVLSLCASLRAQALLD